VEAAILARQWNDDAVLRAALSAAERAGGGRIVEVMAAYGGKFDFDFAPELVLRFPDAPWNALPAEIFKEPEGLRLSSLEAVRWTEPQDRRRILETSASFPPALRSAVRAAVVARWSYDSPREAAEWIHQESTAGREVGKAVTDAAFGSWVRQDPAGVRAWVEGQPSSPLRGHVISLLPKPDIGETSPSSGPSSGAEGFTPRAGPEGTKELEGYVLKQSQKRPAETAAWLMSQSASIDTDTAWDPIMRRWFALDSAAAADWLQALPAGQRRDRAIAAFVTEATHRDPAASAEWVTAIDDPNVRRKAAANVYYTMSNRDAVTARKWVQGLPGVDPRWKSWLLRRF
jgi:hypothetical protein